MPDGPLPSTRTAVHRVGDVVHRSTGPWTPTVHALLRHLEAVGFTGAPRVVGNGFDEQGRETLTFVAGETQYPRPWSDDGIAALGLLLHELHNAAMTFADDAFGHGDVGPWNIVAVDGLPVAFIDWDFAGSVDRLDEVAQCAWLNTLHAQHRGPQLRRFVDGYGLDAHERAGLVTRMISFAERDANGDTRLKIAKHPDGTDGVAWRRRELAWLVAHRAALESALA